MTQLSGKAITAALPGIADVLVEHFDRAPVGLILFAEDRTIIQANRAVAEHTGLAPALLRGAMLRRFLFSESPDELEDRIFGEVDANGSWLGQLDVRTSVADASPMMVSVTAVAPSADGAVRYVGTITELGQQRWIEAESSRRAAELSALSALAVATGSSVEPGTMLRAAARQIVEGLEVDACWIHRYESADGGRLALVGEASYLHPTLRLSTRMIPDAINPGVLRAIETREQVATSELLDRSIATVVHAPLLAAGDVVGVISILSVEGEKLTTHNSELLRAVTYQLGTAIQNVRLLEALTLHQAELEEKNQELERVVEELRAADRLKSEFLANTSHELRTPLNSIIGFLNLVLDGVCESETERQELLGHALKSAKHLLGLINDVLDLARIEAGRLQVDCREVALAPILADVKATMEVQARQKILDFTMPEVESGIRVLGDEARLRQVLVNVIGNAIKFTPEGGVKVSVSASPGSPFVEIDVADTGIGVAEERRGRLFKKFSQADSTTTRKFGGTGLGLVIVKQLIEAMGGSVRLDSAGEGKGTTVSISVPRAASPRPFGPTGWTPSPTTGA
ncbi:MAG TPA: ATP-binding protein [Candidatus Eisenbacteria bacterium]|nr:ATP-binding protein [Candidatus Eisenbacteria bacterium]